MIRAVIFDVGGVLVRTRQWSSRVQLEERLGLSIGASEELVFSSPMAIAAQEGQITDTQLWNWIQSHLGLSQQGLAEFRQSFWAEDFLDAELVDYIQRLRPKYQTAIISNATDTLRHTLTAVHGIGHLFDLIVVSAEEGIMKPESEIYKRTLSRLDRRPDEVVFIDDSPSNVSAAQSLGMHTVHFTKEIDLPATLGRLEVEGEETR
jgi:glucose-1-phosphatase